MMMKQTSNSPTKINKLNNMSIFLRELRINFGYTQEEVSEKLNMHRNTLVRIENSHNFTIKQLLELSDFYEMPVHELLQVIE